VPNPLTPNDYVAFLATQDAAEAGQAKAQYNLGLMYANGVGVAPDYQQALRWYRKSAEKGYAPAQYILAGKLASGQGVERDLRQALSWYLKASERGNSRALFKLGQMLSTPQEELAQQCFEQAAEKGVVEAQMIVGARSTSGDDPQASPGKANSWYQKAADSGFPAARCMRVARD
jgi:TPR repeat protein